jgi:hypothetical protein
VLPEKFIVTEDREHLVVAVSSEDGGVLEGRSGQHLNHFRFGGRIVMRVTAEDAKKLRNRLTRNKTKEEILDSYFASLTEDERHAIPNSKDLFKVNDPQGVNIVHEVPDDIEAKGINPHKASQAIKEFSPRQRN